MGRQSQTITSNIASPLLVDTSVWIDFFNNKKTTNVDMLSSYILNDHTVLLTPIILQEILQGIKNDGDYKRIKEIILNFDTLELNPIDAAIAAAELYRTLRKKGCTIRKSNDCLIAYYAIYFKVPLLQNDSDFKQIAKFSELKLV